YSSYLLLWAGALSASTLVPYRRSSDLREAAEVVCGVESDMRAASQARRVLDRLRERRAEEWRVEVSSNDRATMDAVALTRFVNRSEEHTSELQSRENLVCRLLLEKKKK